MKIDTQKLEFAVLATDVILFTVRENKLLVRLVKVNRPPHFPSIPGLPGGLISPTETADEAVDRVIKEKADVDAAKVYFEQLYTFSGVNRDPRGRVVSVTYIALVPWENLSLDEQKDSPEQWWQVVSNTPTLAYDHNQVLAVAVKRLRFQITNTTISSRFVPKEFTLTRLEKICEIVVGKEIDKRNFRKKILKLKIVKKSNRQLRGVKHRPANLYSFASLKVKEISVL